MENLLPVSMIVIPLRDHDLQYFGALALKNKGKRYNVEIIPSFDFIIVRINGEDIKKIDLGDPERLEQELQKGRTVEMELVLGSEETIKAMIVWRGESLAGGSKAMTMKIVEEMKVEVKKAKPSSEIEEKTQVTIGKIETNQFPFVVAQEIQIFRGSSIIEKAQNWYV